MQASGPADMECLLGGPHHHCRETLLSGYTKDSQDWGPFAHLPMINKTRLAGAQACAAPLR
jgi:hypothetical protein